MERAAVGVHEPVAVARVEHDGAVRAAGAAVGVDGGFGRRRVGRTVSADLCARKGLVLAALAHGARVGAGQELARVARQTAAVRERSAGGERGRARRTVEAGVGAGEFLVLSRLAGGACCEFAEAGRRGVAAVAAARGGGGAAGRGCGERHAAVARRWADGVLVGVGLADRARAAVWARVACGALTEEQGGAASGGGGVLRAVGADVRTVPVLVLSRLARCARAAVWAGVPELTLAVGRGGAAGGRRRVGVARGAGGVAGVGLVGALGARLASAVVQKRAGRADAGRLGGAAWWGSCAGRAR